EILPQMERELCRMDLGLQTRRVTLMCIDTGCQQPTTGPSFLLTSTAYGHNNTYTCIVETSHGQTQEARSKAPRTQTLRHPQPSPCSCLRHLVPREPLFRLQRPSAGALRDAAPAPGGWWFCRRGLVAVWGLPPNFLSGGSGVRTGRPDGSGAQ